MKNIFSPMSYFFAVASIVAITNLIPAAFADETPPAAPTTPAPVSSPAARKVHPCKVVHDACLAAGFAPGKSKEAKGLVKNCVQPLMENQPVPGVSVDPEALAVCKEKRKGLRRVHKNRGNRRKGKPPANSAAPAGATSTPVENPATPATETTQ